MSSAFVLILAAAAAACVSALPQDSVSVPAHSSCQDNNTGWTRGSGPYIKSWIRHATRSVDRDSRSSKRLSRPSKLRSIIPIFGKKSSPLPTSTFYFSPRTNSAIGMSATAGVDDENKNAKKKRRSWSEHGYQTAEGWLYGDFEVGPGKAVNGDNLAYVYSDYSTAIVGRFENGDLVEGRESRITAYRRAYVIFSSFHSRVMKLEIVRITRQKGHHSKRITISTTSLGISPGFIQTFWLQEYLLFQMRTMCCRVWPQR